MSEWFIIGSSQIYGPYSPIQMRELVASGSITPTSRVRLGKDGKVILARKVQGLFDPAPVPEPVAAPVVAPPVVEQESEIFWVGPAIRANADESNNDDDGDEEDDTDYVEEARSGMNRKHPVYTLLLCIWLCLFYQGMWSDAAAQMADNLFDRDDPVSLSGFQVWLFNILGLVFDSVWIALGTGIYAYHFKDRPTWKYIVVGLFLRYLPLLIVLPFVLWKNSLSDVLGAMTEYVAGYELAIQATLQLSLAIGAAVIGANYGKEIAELDVRDNELGYINGISKKVWALLIFSFVSVARFVTELSIVMVHKFSRDVTSSEYWKATWSNLFLGDEDAEGGILKLLFNFMFIWMAWLFTAAVFWWGVEAIKNRETEYRVLKILGIFVLIPVAIVGIPLIRNRTWFF